MEWKQVLEEEMHKAYFQQLMQFVEQEYQSKTIYPPRVELFSCFTYCRLEDVKVVILGQDPYHQKNQAHGLCFSVHKGEKIPPSLRNIYKELESDLGIKSVSHGYLQDWAKQGVFMLNAIFSVEEGKPLSHKNKGWEQFSDFIISTLDQQEQGIVFILWGKWAQQKKSLIKNSKHKIICGAHPSPLSAYHGFFGSKPFSKCNAYLKEMGRTEIDWRIRE